VLVSITGPGRLTIWIERTTLICFDQIAGTAALEGSPDKTEAAAAAARSCVEAGAETDSPAPWDAESAAAALSDSVPCGVILFTPDGELRALNGQFAEIVGCDNAELLALGRFEDLVERLASCFAEPGATAARWRERRERGEACWDELELVSPRRKHVERFARPILNRAGRRVGWMEVYRDVTGQKLIEGNLFHVERMVTLGQLVSSVAHELSNPLTSILGYAQLLRRRRESKQGETDVEHIVQEAERASRIARSLLQFGRGAKTERAAVELNEVVKSALSLRAAELSLEEIDVELDLEPHLPPVLGDALQLQQALLNLLVNSEQAIRQARGRGQIRLGTRRVPSGRVAVDVIDDGPGIPAADLPHIFDPFFTTKPAGVGTGLGLSIAYGMRTITAEPSPWKAGRGRARCLRWSCRSRRRRRWRQSHCRALGPGNWRSRAGGITDRRAAQGYW
jgi:PAS domain S-box-containing protein